MKPRISAIIHTLNEEENIANAIDSILPWTDECIVVDMHSDDQTVEIARAMGAKVFQVDRCGLVEPARMFAEAQATGEWIFILDADEVAPRPLGRELRRIADEDLADICMISRLNYFGGKPLVASGWGPTQDLILRFYRKGSISIPHTIHSKPTHKEGSRVYTLPYLPGMAIVHFNYVDASHFLQKLNRYTTIEAQQDREKDEHVGFYKLVTRPAMEFVNRYIRRGGYKDGWAGFYYCFMMLVYRMTAAMKLRDLEIAGDSTVIRAHYRKIAVELNSGNSDRGIEAHD